MSDTDLEERYEELRNRVEGADGELNLSVTVGGVDITARYKVTPLDKDANTLSEQMDVIERLVDDPRLADAGRLTKALKEADELAKLVIELVNARITEHNLAIAAFEEFAIGGGLPAEMQIRETTQAIIAKMVRAALDANPPKRQRKAPNDEQD